MFYLAELYICITFCFKMVRIYARSLVFAPRTGTPALRRRRNWLIAASTMDWSNPLHFDENADEKLSAVDYFQCRIFKHRISKTTKLLNHVAPSVELMMQMQVI